MTATPVLLPEQGETLSSSSGGKAVASTNTESNNPPPKPRYRYTKEEMYALANSPAAKICPPDIPPYLIRGEPGNSAELRSESAPGDSGRRRSLAQPGNTRRKPKEKAKADSRAENWKVDHPKQGENKEESVGETAARAGAQRRDVERDKDAGRDKRGERERPDSSNRERGVGGRRSKLPAWVTEPVTPPPGLTPPASAPPVSPVTISSTSTPAPTPSSFVAGEVKEPFSPDLMAIVADPLAVLAPSAPTDPLAARLLKSAAVSPSASSDGLASDTATPASSRFARWFSSDSSTASSAPVFTIASPSLAPSPAASASSALAPSPTEVSGPIAAPAPAYPSAQPAGGGYGGLPLAGRVYMESHRSDSSSPLAPVSPASLSPPSLGPVAKGEQPPAFTSSALLSLLQQGSPADGDKNALPPTKSTTPPLLSAALPITAATPAPAQAAGPSSHQKLPAAASALPSAASPEPAASTATASSGSSILSLLQKSASSGAAPAVAIPSPVLPAPNAPLENLLSLLQLSSSTAPTSSSAPPTTAAQQPTPAVPSAVSSATHKVPLPLSASAPAAPKAAPPSAAAAQPALSGMPPQGTTLKPEQLFSLFQQTMQNAPPPPPAHLMYPKGPPGYPYMPPPGTPMHPGHVGPNAAISGLAAPSKPATPHKAPLPNMNMNMSMPEPAPPLGHPHALPTNLPSGSVPMPSPAQGHMQAPLHMMPQPGGSGGLERWFGTLQFAPGTLGPAPPLPPGKVKSLEEIESQLVKQASPH